MRQQPYGVRRLLGGAAWIGGSGLIGRGIGFACSVVVAHMLGPTNFGQLAFGLSLALTFSACASLGLDEFLVREVARDPHRAGPLLADTLVLRMLATLFAFGGAVALALVYPTAAGLALCLAAYAIVNSCLLSACSIFRGRGRMHLQAVLMSGQVVLIALFALAAAWLTGAVDNVAAGYAAGTAAMLALAYVLLKDIDARPRFAWRPRAWARLTRTSTPFALGAIGLLAVDRLALVAVTLVCGAQAAGWFGAVQTVVLALAGFATTASMVAAPLLARAAVRDARAATVLVSDLLRLTSTGGVLLSVALWALAPVVVPLVFGPDYAPSIAILQRMAFSIPAVFVSVVLVGAFEATDGQTTSARCIVAAFPAAGVICGLATWLWGYEGGATAYTVTHLVLAALLVERWFSRSPRAVSALLVSQP